MKFRAIFFLLAMFCLLSFACSRKDTAKTAPKAPEATPTTAEEPGTRESPATGTTLTPDGVQPTEPGGVLITNEKEKKTSETSTSPSSGTIRTTLTDTELATTVKDKLKESEFSAASSIDVLAQDGVVTLKGKVASQEEADRIIVLIKTVPNVKEVISKLTVANP